MSLTRRALLLLLAWTVLRGGLQATDLVLGAAAVAVVIALSPRGDRPLHPPRPLRTLARRVPATLAFVALLAWELVRSSATLGREAVAARPRLHPGVVAVPLEARTPLEVSLVAALVTLTPGSLSLEVDRSGERPVLYVHAFDARDPEALRARVRATFEGPVLRVLR